MLRSLRLTNAGPQARGLALLLSAVLLAANAAAQSRTERPVYRAPSAPVEQRVQDLLSRMTLEEKIAQITAVWTRKNELLDSKGNFDPAAATRLYPVGIGHFTPWVSRRCTAFKANRCRSPGIGCSPR